MGKERRKIVQAGRLWVAVQYSTVFNQNQTGRRGMRSTTSSPARESINARTSREKLERLLAANYKSNDLVVTLTYRDADLPKHREAANKRLDYFIRLLRAKRRERGETLRAVKITEGYHSGGRLHHHVIINSTGYDYEDIRDAWKRCGDNVDFEPFGLDGAVRWSEYLTKEPREKGRRHVGDRTWTATRNVSKPHVLPTVFVPAGETLAPPPGSWIENRSEIQNEYGRYTYVKAWLPEKQTEYNSDLG